jgi:glucose/arabinose dehydrogenase
VRIRCLTASLFVLVGGAAPVAAQYTLENAFPNLTFQNVTDIQHMRDGTRIAVAEKRGVIYVFPEATATTPGQRRVFLDISTKVRNLGEAGLLGLAFHPDYISHNGYFFVYYVSTHPYRNIVARYHVSADPNVADATSELILIDQPKNTVYHNGGQLAFDANRFLYVAMGDDQSSPNAQDLTDRLGDILRIAPNVAGSVPAYAIPDENPFKGNASGYAEEIFAYGMRNPRRFSIDPQTQVMWATDVGQDTYEEINLTVVDGNYGWPLMEGPMCYSPAVCDTAGMNLKAPLYYYDHSEGAAVIGGHVYRGTRLSELSGLYIYGDYGGTVWALDYDGVNPPTRSVLVPSSPQLLTTGVGNPYKSEMYFSSNDGKIYRLASTMTAARATPSNTRLLGNFPNPFNPETTIRYSLERDGRAAIEIVAVDGSRVRVLDQGAREAGAHDVAWRGETDAGGRAASGVYFYRLLVDGVVRDTARMVLVQ